VRRCRTCQIEKPRDAFLPGPRGGWGRSCEPCLEAIAHALNDKRILATTWKAKGRWWRRCKQCGKDKRLASGFYRQTGTTGRVIRGGICKVCHKANVRAAEEQRRKDPVQLAAIQAKQRAWTKQHERSNPEGVKAQRKRYWKKLKQEPARFIAQRETARINYRLRRERAGLPVRPPRSLPQGAIRQGSGPRRLPAAPLVALIDRLVDQRAAVEVFGIDRYHSGVEAVCADLGVSSRTVRRWRLAEIVEVNVGVAERVLMNAGVEWYNVYSYDDHAAVFLAEEVPA
jgi:hypothetical protein